MINNTNTQNKEIFDKDNLPKLEKISFGNFYCIDDLPELDESKICTKPMGKLPPKNEVFSGKYKPKQESIDQIADLEARFKKQEDQRVKNIKDNKVWDCTDQDISGLSGGFM